MNLSQKEAKNAKKKAPFMSCPLCSLRYLLFRFRIHSAAEDAEGGRDDRIDRRWVGRLLDPLQSSVMSPFLALILLRELLCFSLNITTDTGARHGSASSMIVKGKAKLEAAAYLR